MFDGANFMEFCRLLAPFSVRATQDSKVEAIFSVFDVDGDGQAVFLMYDEDRVLSRESLEG